MGGGAGLLAQRPLLAAPERREPALPGFPELGSAQNRVSKPGVAVEGREGPPLSVEGRAERRLSPAGHRLSKCDTGTGVREVWSWACKSPGKAPFQEQVVGRAQRAAPE